MRWNARFAFAVSIVMMSSTAATADETDEYTKVDWPLSVIERPLTLAGGMFEARGDTYLLELSDGVAGDAMSIAPDLYYGINSQFTVGVTHDRGFCFAGDLCDPTYNDVGVEALYGLMRGGNLQFAVLGGLQFPAFDPNFGAGLNFGALARLNVGKVAVRVEPKLYVGVVGRDDVRKETLFLPGEIQVQLNNQTNVFLRSGVEGPLDGFGDAFAVPVGLGATFAINNRLDIGAEFRFTNLLGKDLAAGFEAGADGRLLIGRFALRL